MTTAAVMGSLGCLGCGGRGCRLCDGKAGHTLDGGLREIRLYGTLGKRFGRVHRMAVASVREAVQALGVVLPGFANYLLEHSAPGYHVFLGKRGQNNVGEDRLDAPVSALEPICIVPVVAGAKRGGLFQVILGAALLFFAPYAAGFLFGTGTAFGTQAALAIASFSGKIGAALILGGVVQMLSPQNKPSSSSRVDGAPSYAFDGPVNPPAQGTAVPVRYGRLIVGIIPVSGGIVTEDIVPASAGSAMPTQPLPPEQPVDPQTWSDGP